MITKRLFFVFLLGMVCLACGDIKDETANSENETSKDGWITLKLTNSEYTVVCGKISYDDFMEMFAPGWAWDSVYDIFPDGRIGSINYAHIDGGSLSPFSVQPDNSLKIYHSYEDENDIFHFETTGNYTYSESGNLLKISGIDGFNGGTLIKLTESEMEIVAPRGRPFWSDKDAVLQLFRFRKLTQQDIDSLDSL